MNRLLIFNSRLLAGIKTRSNKQQNFMEKKGEVMRHSSKNVILIIRDNKKEAQKVFRQKGYLVQCDYDSTGTHVSITALMKKEHLVVWEATLCPYMIICSDDKEEHTQTQGLQHGGPWADEIDDILDQIEEGRRLKDEEDYRIEEEKIKRFQLHFSKKALYAP